MGTAQSYFFSGIANGVGLGICVTGILYNLPLWPLLLVALGLCVVGLVVASKAEQL